MDFLYLDLVSTFYFVPDPNLSTVDAQRAVYTIDVLGLNDRDLLRRSRMEAFAGYRARLIEYVTERDSGASPASLALLEDAIRGMSHPAVWRQMVRQSTTEPTLTRLFQQVPEAATW